MYCCMHNVARKQKHSVSILGIYGDIIELGFYFEFLPSFGFLIFPNWCHENQGVKENCIFSTGSFIVSALWN